jgi:hypothetical protein
MNEDSLIYLHAYIYIYAYTYIDLIKNMSSQILWTWRMKIVEILATNESI